MGLLDWLWPSRPNLSTKPDEIHSMTIKTDQGTHTCKYWLERGSGSDRPVMIRNDREFFMPADAKFGVTDTTRVERDGVIYPVLFLAPVPAGAEPENGGEWLSPPEAFQGKWIPAMNNTEIMEDFEEAPLEESKWYQRGRKSKMDADQVAKL